MRTRDKHLKSYRFLYYSVILCFIFSKTRECVMVTVYVSKASL